MIIDSDLVVVPQEGSAAHSAIVEERAFGRAQVLDLGVLAVGRHREVPFRRRGGGQDQFVVGGAAGGQADKRGE